MSNTLDAGDIDRDRRILTTVDDDSDDIMRPPKTSAPSNGIKSPELMMIEANETIDDEEQRLHRRRSRQAEDPNQALMSQSSQGGLYTNYNMMSPSHHNVTTTYADLVNSGDALDGLNNQMMHTTDEDVAEGDDSDDASSQEADSSYRKSQTHDEAIVREAIRDIS